MFPARDKTITGDIVLTRLKEILRNSFDDEAAHDLEDKLYVDVLEAIAAGHAEPEALAHLALESKKIDFSRWCA